MILIGPVSVVLATLPVSFLVLWLIRRNNGAIDDTVRRTFGRFVRLAVVATTGLLASFLTILILTVSANLAIAQISRFSN